MIPGFYNANLGRHFPFVADPLQVLPTASIVDFSCIFLPGAEFVQGTHRVWLAAVRRVSTTLGFYFKTDAPGLADRCLLFEFSTTAARYTRAFVGDRTMPDNTDLNDSLIISMPADTPTGDTCLDTPLWEGTLVVGDLTAVTDWLTDTYGAGPVWLYKPTTSDLFAEPVCIQNLSFQYVRSLGVANKDRTRATSADGCRTLCSANPTDDVHVVRRCTYGSVLFEPGYNMEVVQNTADNIFTFVAAVGSGLGEPTNELPQFPGEVTPTGRSTYSGSLRCCDTINSINGVSTRSMLFDAGAGVRIINKPDQHRIVIAVDLHNMALCPPQTTPENVVCLHPDENVCVCGPEDIDTFVCPDNSTPESL